MFENVRTLITRQIASWRVFKFVTTSIWLALTAVDILITAPCGNTIIVLVCSSNGSVRGATPRATSVTREPCTLTGTSRESASGRKCPPPADACFGGAPACGTAVTLPEFVASTESFVSGAIVLGGSTPCPQRNT